jgi:hypothetical protein
MPRGNTAAEPTQSIPPGRPADARQLFDILAAVAYLCTLGADSATPNFVRGLITSSAIPHLKIGKKFYVRREDLDGWIANHARRRRG